MKTQGFKKLSMRFLIDRKLDSIDQKLDLIDRKLYSIDPKAIEQRSKLSGSNQNFNRIFDRSSNRFDRSKIWKTKFIEKQSNFMQKIFKA